MSCMHQKMARLTGASTAFVVALSMSAAHAATTAKQSCSINMATAKMKVLALEGTTINFGTTAFNNLLDTAVNFTQSKAGCVLVQFSGDVESVPGRAILVRAVITPSTIATPAQVTFVSRDETGLDEVSNAANFVFPTVAAGAHTLRIQWHGTDSGLPVYFGNRTVVVYYQ